MKPFFGLSNRLSCILVSFLIFGYAMYTVLNDVLLSSEIFRFIKIYGSSSHSEENSHGTRTIRIKYNFDSATASLFGLYEFEIAIIKTFVSFLLFIILLVGATQRSKILLRIWMMIHALVIVLGFLATIISLTDSHLNNNPNGVPTTHTLTKFIITLLFSVWFFAIVISLHEEIEMKEQRIPEETIIRNYVVAKKGSAEEKCPPYYDC